MPYKVGKVPFQAIAKALIGGEYEGFAKVIGHTETNDTLGVHIIGPHATDLIAEASLAFELEATPWEIGGSTHPHPTLTRGHRRGRDGRRRPVDQLLMASERVRGAPSRRPPDGRDEAAGRSPASRTSPRPSG